MRKKQKRLFVPIIVVIVIVLLFVISPYPASFLLRAVFNFPNIEPLSNQTQMEEAIYVVSDITYPSDYARNTVDLYLPKEVDDKFPVIIWAHGGAYVGGDKTDIRYYATALASEGYAVVSMNYALAPEEKYPVPLTQVDEVYKWIVSSQEEYNLDATQLVLAGDSAGAHIMTQFALIQTSQDYADLIGWSSSVDAEDIKGMLLYCGPYDVARTVSMKGFIGFMLHRAAWAYFGSYDWPDIVGDEISVIEHMTENFPPSFVTDSNTLSFTDHSEKLVEVMEQNNVPVDAYFMSINEEKTVHEYQFIMNTPAGQECYARTVAFLKRCIL